MIRERNWKLLKEGISVILQHKMDMDKVLLRVFRQIFEYVTGCYKMLK